MKQTIISKNVDPTDEFCLGIVVETIDGQRPSLDVIVALREAAGEFLWTEDGKKVLEETNGRFNWGDLVEYLPAEVCERHGVRIVDTFQTDLVVFHNEILLA